MDIYEFSQHILQLKKEKKFSEILSYFKEHKDSFSSEGIGTNKYLVSSIISALIELGYYNQIFDFLLVHKASLDAKSFFFLYKQLKDKTTMNRDFVNKFCDLWDPSLLDSNDCFTIEVERKGKKNPMELASSRENWYALKTKALMELGLRDECYLYSKKALSDLTNFHYNNDSRFARRIALSKAKLGKPDEALQELLEIVSKKKEWYIQAEIAQLYNDKGDKEKAFTYAINAINNFGDIEYKVNLLMLLGDLISNKGEKDVALKHYILSKLLRIDSGRKVPQELEEKIRNIESINNVAEEKDKLLYFLKKYRADLKPVGSVQGKITTLLKNKEGKSSAGFIETIDGNRYWFSFRSFSGKRSDIKEGLNVSFDLEDGYDKAKDRMVKNAVNISSIK